MLVVGPDDVPDIVVGSKNTVAFNVDVEAAFLDVISSTFSTPCSSIGISISINGIGASSSFIVSGTSTRSLGTRVGEMTKNVSMFRAKGYPSLWIQRINMNLRG